MQSKADQTFLIVEKIMSNIVKLAVLLLVAVLVKSADAVQRNRVSSTTLKTSFMADCS